MSLGCKKSKMFSMSDNFELENNSAAFIVRSTASAVLGEVRKISNKIMVKGETIVEIAFIPHEDKSTIVTVRKNLPINQILEFDGMDERFTGDITLDVTAVDVIIKNDSQGDGRSLDVGVTINAGITMWEQKDITVITDAYAINGDVDLTYKKMQFYSALDAVRDTFIFKDTIDASKLGAECILDACCEVNEPVATFENGSIIISGTIKAMIILKDTSGGYVTTEKMLDYRYERTCECDNKKIECTPKVSVSSFECSLKNNEQIDVKAELQINCSVFAETEIDVVSDISELRESEKVMGSAITVYFPNCEETLWDIAKRYNTTVESIVLENNLVGETTKDIKMLFIPSGT
jgi:LysM repeat protein